ncbi:hypothetical protein J6590_081211 [Homalodisca vitripennis]|nr:hypothetical protein J6590_081211 [Homalodisca vitripennis]
MKTSSCEAMISLVTAIERKLDHAEPVVPTGTFTVFFLEYDLNCVTSCFGVEDLPGDKTEYLIFSKNAEHGSCSFNFGYVDHIIIQRLPPLDRIRGRTQHVTLVVATMIYCCRKLVPGVPFGAGGKTQNPNESFDNTVWSIIPKRVFLTLSTVKYGVYSAVCAFNDGFKCKVEIFVKVVFWPGTNLKKLRYSRALKRERLEDQFEEEEDPDNPSYRAGHY